MTEDKGSRGNPTVKGTAPEVLGEPQLTIVHHKRLKLKAAADSGVSLLAGGRGTVGRDTEAPVSPAGADRATEGLLPRARAQSKEDVAPRRPRDRPDNGPLALRGFSLPELALTAGPTLSSLGLPLRKL